jgi:hypothetical protein
MIIVSGLRRLTFDFNVGCCKIQYLLREKTVPIPSLGEEGELVDINVRRPSR